MKSLLTKICIDCGKEIDIRSNRCKSCAVKGKRNFFYGRKHSEETKRKIGLASKGRNLGFKYSDETRKKMSLIHKGETFKKQGIKNLKGGMLGKKHSEKTKRKLSQIHKGTHHSEETKKKMREIQIKRVREGKNHLWKGGITPKTNKRINSFEWKQIRRQIYKRDNWTCQICGKTKIRVNAHHIIPYRVSLDNNLTNLITLCDSCHRKEETKYYKKLKGQGEFSFI